MPSLDLNALAILCALLGLLLLLVALRRLARGRWVAGGGGALLGALLVALGVALGGVAANLYTYHRLTAEQVVATLEFRALGPQRYAASLHLAEGQTQSYELRGDEWQLDARVLKWQGPAQLLGLDNLYRLERLSGRFHDLERERDGPRSVYALSQQAGVDLWRLAREHRRWLPWVDAVYGSATYLPLADEARYVVTLTQTGLVARAEGEPATQALERWQ